jgi:uncharacterized repeat protein (TIGR02543 family)
MIKRIYLLILVMLFAAPGLLAQSPTITIGDVVGDPGEILVPVYMENFPNVASVEVWINIDTDVVDFLGVANPDPDMGGTWFANYNSNHGAIILTWGATIGNPPQGANPDGRVVDLRLNYKAAFETELTFNVERSEIVNLAFNPFTDVNFVNGTIGPDGFVGSVYMDAIESPIGEEVHMPVTIGGAGLSAVSSINLVIAIHPEQLDYVGVVPAAGVTNITANETDSEIVITWTGDETDFTEDTHLLDIVVTYMGGGIAPLTFTGGSEVTAFLGTLPIEFIDGMISPTEQDAKLILADVAIYVEELPDPGSPEDVEPMYVDIPISADNITDDIASINLVIGYDADQIDFEEWTAVQLTGWSVNEVEEGTINIAWTDGNGVEIEDGEVLVLTFAYFGAVETDITFRGGSTLAKPDLGFAQVSFVDGSLIVSDEKFDLVLLVEPEDAGTVTGAGEYLPGTEIEVDAVAAEGYVFLNWTDLDGNVVSEVTANTITMVPGGLTLVANFEEVKFNVTFNVNMTYVDGYHHEFTFDPENDVVYVTGNIFGWAEPGSEPELQTMVPSDDDPMIYTLTIELPAGEYAYKYFLNDGWDGGEWEGGDDRTFEVVDEDVVLNDWFGSLNDPTNVPEVDPITLQVYPNPARDVLNIVSSELIQEVRLINMLGQMIHTSTVESANVQLNVSGFDRGIYFIQILTDKGFTTERVQISR